MEELSNCKSPCAWVFPGLWDVANGLAITNGLAIWSGRWSVEGWTTTRLSLWGMALWKSLWKFEGCIKVGHVDAHQKNHLLLPGSEGDWNDQVDLLLHYLEVAI